MRLRGGITAGRGRKLTIKSMPRAKSMKQTAPEWASEYGGKTIDINGTSYYHYEFKVNKKDPAPLAIEKLKGQLRKYGGVAELIDECGDDPRKLERYLDEALFTIDCWKQAGRLPEWVCEGTPELRRDKTQANHARAESTRKKRENLEKAVHKRLQGRESTWFDTDDKEGVSEANVSEANVSEAKVKAASGAGNKTARGKATKRTRDKDVKPSHTKRPRATQPKNSTAAHNTSQVLPVSPLRGGAVSIPHGALGTQSLGAGGAQARWHANGVLHRVLQASQFLRSSHLHAVTELERGGGGGVDAGGKRYAQDQDTSVASHSERPRVPSPPNANTGGVSSSTSMHASSARGAAAEGVDAATEHEEESISKMCERAQELFEYAQDYDGAEALYKRVLALDPDHVDTLCNYALLIETTQDEDADQDTAAAELDHADAMYSKAACLEPNSTDVLYQHALFLKNVRGDYDAAEALMKRVLQLDPHDATTLCNYGLLLQHVRNDAAGAQKLYQRALALPGEALSDEENVSLLYSY